MSSPPNPGLSLASEDDLQAATPANYEPTPAIQDVPRDDDNLSIEDESSNIALSRYQTASANSNAAAAEAENVAIQFTRVVYKRNDRYFATYMAGPVTNSGEDDMMALKELDAHELPGGKHFRRIREAFYTPVIEIATIYEFSPTALEAQDQRHQVIVTERKLSVEFTAGFREPPLLRTSGSFINKNPNLLASPTTREALLRTHKLNKPSVVKAVCASFVVSGLVGVGAGVKAKSASVGAEVAGPFVAFVAAVEVLLIWMAK